MSSIRFLKYTDLTAMKNAITAGSITNDDIVYGRDDTIAFNGTAYNLVPTTGTANSLLKLNSNGKVSWTTYDILSKEIRLSSGPDSGDDDSIPTTGWVSNYIDSTKITVDSTLSSTSANPVQNKTIYTALSNKADKESYVQLKITGTAIAHYSLATSVPTTTSGYYLADTNLSGSIHRVIVIVAGGAVVNELSPSNGDTYITTSDGHLWAATANNTTAWTDCGQIKGDQGAQGEQGYGMVATVSRPSLTEAQWTLYGTLNRNEEWSDTSGTRNGCRIGDLFTVSGTSTDGGRAHFLLFRSTTATGNLTGTCIGHTTAERGKAATVKVGTVTTGETGSDVTVTNSGTAEDVVLDFKIPKGEQGDVGHLELLKVNLKNSPKCFLSANQDMTVQLTEEQAERINRNRVITVVFKAVMLNEQPRYCGVRVPPNSIFTTTQVIDGFTYWNGINFVRCYNQYGYHFQSSVVSYPSGGLDACVNLDKGYYGCLMFVLNRVEGWAYIYDETGKMLGSRHHASLKYDKFISDSRYLELRGDPCNLVEVSIYDGDLSGVKQVDMFTTPQTLHKENWGDACNTSPSVGCIYGAESWKLNEDDGLYHITSATAKLIRFETFDFYGSKIMWTTWKKFRINSGTFRFKKGVTISLSYGNDSLHVYNEDGDEVTDDTLSAGVYTVYSTSEKEGVVGGTCSDNFDMNFIEGESTKVTDCFCIDNFETKEKYIYDRSSDMLMRTYSLSNNNIVEKEFTAIPCDLHNVETQKYNIPTACYIGRMKRQDGKLYMVGEDYTWKQINNV